MPDYSSDDLPLPDAYSDDDLPDLVDFNDYNYANLPRGHTNEDADMEFNFVPYVRWKGWIYIQRDSTKM
jgi:hypothetical protein